jgi:hypothetical protein
MKRSIILSIFAVLLIAPGLAQSQSSNSAVDPGFLPGYPMHTFETAVERAEVRLAGVIGGPDLKAKAIANNAQERLAEANALADQNRSEEASRAVEKYGDAMTRSQQIADRGDNSELSEQIRNVSGNNVEQLEQVRERVPEQARKGIERAIRNSERNGRANLSNENSGIYSNGPEVPSNQSPGLEDKGPDVESRRPNQSVRDLNNSNNNPSLNDSVPKVDSGHNNSDRDAKSRPDLDEDSDSGLNRDNEDLDQADQSENSDEPVDGVTDTENLSNSLGGQPPNQ